MGTTTTNFALYKPTVGETGWGATVDSSTFDTIDTVLATMVRSCGRFSYTSTTVCTFAPYNGTYIMINGNRQAIPSAGVAFSNTTSPSALANSTLYYAYVFMSGATMTGEFSTTAYATDTTTGVTVKNGDSTRTLVGMVYTSGTGTFTFSSSVINVRSWFNRQFHVGFNPMTANRTTVSGTVALISATSEYVEWVNWNDEYVYVAIDGAATNSIAGTSVITCVGIDTAAKDGFAVCQPSNNSYSQTCACSWGGTLTEGHHTAQIMGRVGGNTGTWIGAGSSPERCATMVVLGSS